MRAEVIVAAQTGNLELIVNIYNSMLATLVDVERPLVQVLCIPPHVHSNVVHAPTRNSICQLHIYVRYAAHVCALCLLCNLMHTCALCLLCNLMHTCALCLLCDLMHTCALCLPCNLMPAVNRPHVCRDTTYYHACILLHVHARTSQTKAPGSADFFVQLL